MSDSHTRTYVGPKLPMHAWRSLHSHYCERISQTDPLAEHLRRLTGYTFSGFIRAFGSGTLVTETKPHNGLDWYVINYSAGQQVAVVAACAPFLGLTGDRLVEIEAERATSYFERLLGSAE